MQQEKIHPKVIINSNRTVELKGSSSIKCNVTLWEQDILDQVECKIYALRAIIHTYHNIIFRKEGVNDGEIRKGGDIGLFITLVAKVL